MTDHPIIFSAPMIRALLDGRKTQTRRLAWREGETPFDSTPSPWQRVKPGDRLWVRETWALTGEFAASTAKFLRGFHSPFRMLDRYMRYRADADGYDEATQAWRPSIHMPRWASRITLEVIGTKLERLQSISADDIVAEGAKESFDSERAAIRGPFARDAWEEKAQYAFEALWESLHGVGAWDANPEVVAISFKVERRNIDAAVRRAAAE